MSHLSMILRVRAIFLLSAALLSVCPMAIAEGVLMPNTTNSPSYLCSVETSAIETTSGIIYGDLDHTASNEFISKSTGCAWGIQCPTHKPYLFVHITKGNTRDSSVELKEMEGGKRLFKIGTDSKGVSGIVGAGSGPLVIKWEPHYRYTSTVNISFECGVNVCLGWEPTELTEKGGVWHTNGVDRWSRSYYTIMNQSCDMEIVCSWKNTSAIAMGIESEGTFPGYIQLKRESGSSDTSTVYSYNASGTIDFHQFIPFDPFRGGASSTPVERLFLSWQSRFTYSRDVSFTYTCLPAGGQQCSSFLTSPNNHATIGALNGSIESDWDGMDSEYYYVRGEDCRWEIRCPAGYTMIAFIRLSGRFSTYSVNDTLKILDAESGVTKNTFRGTFNSPMYVSASHVFVNFFTSSTTRYVSNGFTLKYRCDTRMCSSKTPSETVYRGINGTITSDQDGYRSDNFYLLGESCEWEIQCPSNNDYNVLLLFRGRISSRTTLSAVSQQTLKSHTLQQSSPYNYRGIFLEGGGVKIVFNSEEESTPSYGFTIHWRCVRNVCSGSGYENASKKEKGATVLTKSSGTIYSNNRVYEDDAIGNELVGKKYFERENCTWEIQCPAEYSYGFFAVQTSVASSDSLSVKSLDVGPGSSEYTSMNYNANSGYETLLEGRRFLVSFTSSTSTSGDKYSFDYWCRKSRCSSTLDTTKSLTAVQGAITSDFDGAKSRYYYAENEDCLWTISCPSNNLFVINNVEGKVSSNTIFQVRYRSLVDGTTVVLMYAEYESTSLYLPSRLAPNEEDQGFAFNLSTFEERITSTTSNDQSTTQEDSAIQARTDKGRSRRKYLYDRIAEATYIEVRLGCRSASLRSYRVGLTLNYTCSPQRCSSVNRSSETFTQQSGIIVTDFDGEDDVKYITGEQCQWTLKCPSESKYIRGETRRYEYMSFFFKGRTSSPADYMNLYVASVGITKKVNNAYSNDPGTGLHRATSADLKFLSRNVGSPGDGLKMFWSCSTQKCSSVYSDTSVAHTGPKGTLMSDVDGAQTAYGYFDNENCTWTVDCSGSGDGAFVVFPYIELRFRSNSRDSLSLYEHRTSNILSEYPYKYPNSHFSSAFVSDKAKVDVQLVTKFASEVNSYTSRSTGVTVQYECRKPSCSSPNTSNQIHKITGKNTVTIFSDEDGKLDKKNKHFNDTCKWTFQCKDESASIVASFKSAQRGGSLVAFQTHSESFVLGNFVVGYTFVTSDRSLDILYLTAMVTGTSTSSSSSDAAAYEFRIDVSCRPSSCSSVNYTNEVISKEKGIIVSDVDGPGSHPFSPFEDCSWRIKCPSTAYKFMLVEALNRASPQITFWFNEPQAVDTSSNGTTMTMSTGDDTVETRVYEEGYSSSGYASLYIVPYTELDVLFVSSPKYFPSGQPAYHGVSLRYQCLKTRCSSIGTQSGTTLTYMYGEIRSDTDGEGPMPYAGNEDCRWEIRCPYPSTHLRVSSDYAVRDHDEIQILDVKTGVGMAVPFSKFTTSTNRSLVLTNAIIYFTSVSPNVKDHSEATGFNIYYTCMLGTNNDQPAGPVTFIRSSWKPKYPEACVFLKFESSDGAVQFGDMRRGAGYSTQCAWELQCRFNESSILITVPPHLDSWEGREIQVYEANTGNFYNSIYTQSKRSYLLVPSNHLILHLSYSPEDVRYGSDNSDRYDAGINMRYTCLPPLIARLPARMSTFSSSSTYIRPRNILEGELLYVVSCINDRNQNTQLRKVEQYEGDSARIVVYNGDTGEAIVDRKDGERWRSYHRDVAAFFFVYVHVDGQVPEDLTVRFGCTSTSLAARTIPGDGDSGIKSEVFAFVLVGVLIIIILVLVVIFVVLVKRQQRRAAEAQAASPTTTRAMGATAATNTTAARATVTAATTTTAAATQNRRQPASDSESEMDEVEELTTRQVSTISIMSTATDTSQPVCCICIAHRPTHICVPCGHLVLCGLCLQQYSPQVCPICRTRCQRVIAVTFLPTPADGSSEPYSSTSLGERRRSGLRWADRTPYAPTTGPAADTAFSARATTPEAWSAPQQSDILGIGDSVSATFEPQQRALPSCLQCEDLPALCAPVPCGHVCLCESCHPERCPVCNKKCRSIVRVYK